MDGAIERGAAAASMEGTAPGRLDLRVAGMSCASCVRRVERATAAVPGVEQVAVNLAAERASIIPRPGLNLPELVSKLGAAGYKVAEDTVDLAITGMS